MTTFVIKKNLLIDASPSLVFDALTNSNNIIQYFPLKEVVSTWEVGSDIILKGSNGGQDFIDYGRIEIFSPNKKFQYTYWSDNHGTDRLPENYLTICYTLHEVDKGTNLELEHKNFKSEKMYSEMLKIWDLLLSNLKNFVERK
ncbi:MAG: SRPBCC domain-containing protein [Chlorogloeopsis fritschii C42_A2020_084]|uniref:SRPBCC family protein n=1 Tax=Chlorogloeopsis fritschii TaxID=1124 RepID=UPI0019EB5C99|nr:SRPBCC domain-containing protein [Chlorogloeopsis fritschii]MBF2005968.1 SRPBCC domain-containing protein [Chlorogloeopsis fritschii C42_A2020_084]